MLNFENIGERFIEVVHSEEWKNLQEKYNTQARLSEDLEAALKKANRKTKLYKIGTYIGAGALVLLLAK